MHKLVQDLDAKLRKSPRRIKKKIINDVFWQVVPQRETGKQKVGDYQKASEGGRESFLEVLLYLDGKLEHFRMINKQKMLRDHYSGLYDTHYHRKADEQ